ncbi:MAG: AarF/ABC1/UbiB kinase family protein [Acidobacteria bacterium]|nr:AarF/ABC1/UbiB kinase family protein [Acidobacteriota bacterium]
MADDQMITSAVRRVVKLGGLAGRVGASVVGNQVLDLARSGPAKQVRKTENLVRNAIRIVETLGEMKGAAMKIGQMLSLHEGLLPPEVAEVLRGLQQEAPTVPAEVMEYEIRGSLENFDEIFENLDFEAFAAASIGQVHLGRLRDGREVAVKIQYPLIDEIVKADLKNLKTLLRALLGLITEIDFEPIWSELRDRLLEELDYTHEAANIRHMAGLHADVPEIIIPRVVTEATARNVLTMEYVGGINPTDACSDRFSREMRNRWGIVLAEFLMRGLLEHRFIHSDPNIANFAFLEDGRVVVYDFGCVKAVPEPLANGYARLLLAAAEGRGEEISGILQDIGVHLSEGEALPVEAIDPYIEMFGEILRADPPYTFGDDEGLYRRLFELGFSNMEYSREIAFPEDAIFIDRAFGGHFGNLSRLGATGPWREIAVHFASRRLGIV